MAIGFILTATVAAAAFLSLSAHATKELERVNAIAKQCAAEILADATRRTSRMEDFPKTTVSCYRCESGCEWEVHLRCVDFPKGFSETYVNEIVDLNCPQLANADLLETENRLVKQAAVNPLVRAVCDASGKSLVETPAAFLKITQRNYDKLKVQHLADFLGQRLGDFLKKTCQSSVLDKATSLTVQCKSEPAKVAVVCPKKEEKQLLAVEIAKAYDANNYQGATKTMAMVKLLLCEKVGDVAKQIDELKRRIYAVASKAHLDKELEKL